MKFYDTSILNVSKKCDLFLQYIHVVMCVFMCVFISFHSLQKHSSHLTYVFLSLELSNCLQLAEISHTHTHRHKHTHTHTQSSVIDVHKHIPLNMGMKFFSPGPFARVGLFVSRVWVLSSWINFTLKKGQSKLYSHE